MKPADLFNFTIVLRHSFGLSRKQKYKKMLQNFVRYSALTNSRILFSQVPACYYSSSTQPNTGAGARRPSALTDEIIRVDHAGELGADRIYAGQMAVLGNGPMGKTIAHMWDQEKEHRRQFEELIRKHRVRPTVMTPIWNVAGFVLGAASALMGEKAAMACTVAVETVIVDHYNEQLRQIMDSPNPDKELLETITKFRDEEQEHHDTGIDCGAEQAPFYKAMTEVIKVGCKTAIAISKKI